MLTIRLISPADIAPIAAAFTELGWDKPASQYEQYLSEQEAGQRVVLVAHSGVQNLSILEFAGYVTICWQSHYLPFCEQNIPEIVDFNVLPKFRRQGIGAALMDEAESRVAAVSQIVGLGVGMTSDYGAAQRMYAKRGYIPDGRGLHSRGQPVQYGQSIPVDDDLVLYFTKLLG
jgi:GNAT superfamily N-acetyltransferase